MDNPLYDPMDLGHKTKTKEKTAKVQKMIISIPNTLLSVYSFGYVPGICGVESTDMIFPYEIYMH
jgi:hypothetical protein